MRMFVFEARLADGQWMACPFAPESEAKALETVEYMNRIDPSFAYRAVPVTDESVAPEQQVKAITLSYTEFCVLISTLSVAIGNRALQIGRLSRERDLHLVEAVQRDRELLQALYRRLGGGDEVGR
jgi:hypothetical protein